MKLKNALILVFVICSLLFACSNQGFEKNYNKKSLSKEDCLNTKLASWLLYKETGLDLRKKDIKIITTSYSGGIPLHIKHFPIYYKVLINEKEYSGYKKRFSHADDSDHWRYYEDDESLHYARVSQFELSCSIEKGYILFGFRNVNFIFP